MVVLATLTVSTAASAFWSPNDWGGNNNRWGNNNPWSGGGMPWGGNNRGWGGNNNWMPWGGNNNWMPWGGNNNRWGRSSSTPWGGNNNWMPWGGNTNRWNRGRRSSSTPWSSGPWGNMSGPWDQGPWNSDWNRGRSDDWWGSGPKAWMDPEDPKGSMGRIWDDMLAAPNEFGEMPGGWNAPSISVPNPVEVGDEFESSSRKAPKEAAEQADNFRFN